MSSSTTGSGLHSQRRFFLNATKKDGRLTQPTPAGSWMDKEDFLETFVGDMGMETQLDDAGLSHSVPSVFARPLQFAQAFGQPGNPIHDEVVSAWRGLLALFAFRDWYGFRLRAEELELPMDYPAELSIAEDEDEDAPTANVQYDPEHRLRVILRAELPHPAADWRRMWLLYCDDRLIGATSPWTIAYTAADYVAPGKISWQDEGKLIDPREYFDPEKSRKGASPELAWLYQWVSKVDESFNNTRAWGFPADFTVKAQAVRRELDLWKAELKGYANPAFEFDVFRKDVPVSEEPYRYFLVTPDGLPHRHLHSDLLLASTQKDAPPTIALRPGLREEQRVYGAVRVRDIDLPALEKRGQQDKGWKTRHGDSVGVPYVFPEKVFLPEKLVQIDVSEHALTHGAPGYATPLTETFFKYFTHGDLVAAGGSMLNVHRVGNEVEVTLLLPLRHSSDPMRISRRYSDSEIVRPMRPNESDSQTNLLKGHVPGLAFWPDFVSEEWPHNYAIESTERDTNLMVAPIVTDGEVLPRTSPRLQNRVRVWETDKPLIGFALYHFPTGTEVPVPLGTLLRKRLKESSRANIDTRWRVAVDFGSSSTHVRVDANGQAGPMRFPARTQLLTIPGTTAHRDRIDLNLYPTESVGAPFATLLWHREIESLNQPVGAAPYFPVFRFYEDDLKPLHKDVKWASGSGEDAPLKQYLRGLARAILCEAFAGGASRVVFHWAYPLSLPPGPLQAMREFWNGIANSNQVQQLSVEVQDGISESAAMLRSLKGNEQVTVASGLSILVDVGGGSTDVAFWGNRGLLDQFSMKLAGNDILTPARSQKDFAVKLYRYSTGRTESEKSDKEIIDMFNLRPAQSVNHCLAYGRARGGDQILGELPPAQHPFAIALFDHELGSNRQPWVLVRSAVYLFYMGLCYYLGLYCRRWANRLPESTVIYFGGRGSGLLSWLSTKGDMLQEVASYAFKKGLTADGSDQSSVKVRLKGPAIDPSEALVQKTEVVLGLLEGRAADERLPAGTRKAIVGELGWTDEAGETIDWDHMLDAGQMARIKPPSTAAGGYVDRFLSDVAPKFVSTLRLETALRTDSGSGALVGIGPDWAQVQEHLAESVRDDRALQPVFVWALKSTLDTFYSAHRLRAESASAGGRR